MAGSVLGSGVNRAYIYDRRGESRVATLPGTSQIVWGRTLNDISTATITVTIPSSGAERDACCGDLGRIHTWANTLVVYRSTDDGDERVWEGPVTRLEHSSTGLLLSAWDVLGWLKKRRIRTARSALGVPVIPEAQADISQGFGLDDPNVLAYVQTLGTPSQQGHTIDRDVQVDSAYIWDDLSSLCDAGLRVTTIGRRILLAPQNVTIGQTALLLPESHILGDVTVIEDGESLATAASARDDKGHSAYVLPSGTSQAVDPFYGLVESIVSTGAGAQPTTGSVTSYATAEVHDHYPAPVILAIPDQSVLVPGAPFPMSSLVPGTFVPAISRATCVDVQATFMLSAVTVTQGAGGSGGGSSTSEQVQISVQPIANEVISAYDQDAVVNGLEAVL